MLHAVTHQHSPTNEVDGHPLRLELPAQSRITRRLAFAGLLFLATLAGCQDPDRAKIVGTWEIERADKIASRLGVDEALDPSNADESRMSITFTSGGKLTTNTIMGDVKRSKNGTWKLAAADESTSTIDCVLEGQQSSHEIKWIDDSTIELVPPNMAGLSMKLRFKRN